MTKQHKTISWKTFAAAGLAVSLLAGCQHKTRPFEDVVSRSNQPMIDEPPTQAGQPAPAVSPATPSPTTQPAVTPPVAATTPPATIPALVTPPPNVIVPPSSPNLPNANIIRLVPDPAATVRRDWSTSAAYRPSGDVLAGPTYWQTADKAPTRPDWQNAFIEPGQFLFGFFTVPVQAVITPPWTPVIYSPSGKAGQENKE